MVTEEFKWIDNYFLPLVDTTYEVLHNLGTKAIDLNKGIQTIQKFLPDIDKALIKRFLQIA